jgi:hypothetical protein
MSDRRDRDGAADEERQRAYCRRHGDDKAPERNGDLILA